MTNKKPAGVMGANYHEGRLNKKSLSYRLKRRTYETIQAIGKYASKKKTLLDLGTADGMMLSLLKDRYPNMNCLGLEYSQELIDTNLDKRFKIYQGDILSPPIQITKKKYDIVVATAVVEHLSNLDKFSHVISQITLKDSIVIITTPVPFFEKIATAIGHLPLEDHQETFNLNQLEGFFKKRGFWVLESKKFMFSPIGFPGEVFIEKILRKLKATFFFANQLLVLGKN